MVLSEAIHNQKNYYNAPFAQFFLTFVLATASYHLIETPLQVLSTRISRALTWLEGDGGAVLALNGLHTRSHNRASA